MSKFNTIALLLVATATFAVNAMEQGQNRSLVSKITPETILGLLAPLATEQEEIVTSWKRENAWTLGQLTEITSFNDFPKTHKENDERLEVINRPLLKLI